MRLKFYLDTNNWEYLCQAIESTIGIKVDPGKLKEFCQKRDPLNDGFSSIGRADDTVMMWLRNRIDEMGAIWCGKNENGLDHVPVIFHIGFVGVIETDEHLERLRSLSEEIKRLDEARSKISQTNLVIQPIDRVAARVAPMEDNNG